MSVRKDFGKQIEQPQFFSPVHKPINWQIPLIEGSRVIGYGMKYIMEIEKQKKGKTNAEKYIEETV